MTNGFSCTGLQLVHGSAKIKINTHRRVSYLPPVRDLLANVFILTFFNNEMDKYASQSTEPKVLPVTLKRFIQFAGIVLRGLFIR